MKNVMPRSSSPDDEWYTYDKSPRPNVRVLANVDEFTYTPASDVKMGDHPVVWVNEKVKARNVYFQMGAQPEAVQVRMISPQCCTMPFRGHWVNDVCRASK